MSLEAEFCDDCGVRSGGHATNCPRVNRTFGPFPLPTAYDRSQTELGLRINAALRRIEALEAHTARLENERASIFQAFGGVEPLIKRVEALELEVAVLRSESPRFRHITENTGNTNIYPETLELWKPKP